MINNVLNWTRIEIWKLMSLLVYNTFSGQHLEESWGDLTLGFLRIFYNSYMSSHFNSLKGHFGGRIQQKNVKILLDCKLLTLTLTESIILGRQFELFNFWLFTIKFRLRRMNYGSSQWHVDNLMNYFTNNWVRSISTHNRVNLPIHSSLTKKKLIY